MFLPPGLKSSQERRTPSGYILVVTDSKHDSVMWRGARTSRRIGKFDIHPNCSKQQLVSYLRVARGFDILRRGDSASYQFQEDFLMSLETFGRAKIVNRIRSRKNVLIDVQITACVVSSENPPPGVITQSRSNPVFYLDSGSTTGLDRLITRLIQLRSIVNTSIISSSLDPL